ncbi:Inosine-5'-monophosphate dehydrogenase [Sporomusa silvacetica DSM 10669]|uniref:Inosine-5'-monophosphate dehydrogenase n=1 Tax=Sporomusa silvacetica DSM 10669 TaxID=1123289 RepID=A0ABZ3IHR9_9FIRM|nr:CBS domain-containing protein [Sporomusa silvacetica]OZC17437.1 hypoxic response protein 1 [Sporomusa silvacetica DSM 10669]
MKAKDIMVKKVITVHKNDTIAQIAKVLVDQAISGVPVVDDEGSLVGIVSEGDLLHKGTTPRVPSYVNILGAIIYYNGVEQYNADFKKLMAEQAASIMTEKVVSISEEIEIDEIAKLMLQHSIKRIPVVKNNKIIGIISRRDLIKLLIK